MKNALLLFAVLLGMAACAPAVAVPTRTAAPATETPTPTPLPSATITSSPIPTEISIPQGLENVPEGYSAVLNPDGTWGYGIGANAKTSIPDLTVDVAGAHFRLDGKSIDIAPADIPARIQVGQEGALQIYDYDKYGFYGIEYAWKADQNGWIKAADIRQSHREDIPNYITVQTRAQLEALFNLEKLVMSPFPKDTYFPPLDKVIVDYMGQYVTSTGEGFNVTNPFGTITDASKSPFRSVNFILLQKGEGRKLDTYILTEQVYNTDGTFSLLHFGFDKYGEKTGFMDKGLSSLFFASDPQHMALPAYEIYVTGPYPGYAACDGFWCNQIEYFIENNDFDAKTGRLPKIQQWVREWLTTGRVPEDFENVVNLPETYYITEKIAP
jgi:hypothetical protein